MCRICAAWNLGSQSGRFVGADVLAACTRTRLASRCKTLGQGDCVEPHGVTVGVSDEHHMSGLADAVPRPSRPMTFGDVEAQAIG